ncbi:SLC13 family permease [Ideonella sp. 4Y16]|uniref:SLC13 family permease n=1 Tax=Ideonella alba TaxID=2824118 RepID=UPI001B367620|nr:SLC13 family permease [Ideonella alba]MBQ0943137.1 SLC13 family permease [Ideonella alba]
MTWQQAVVFATLALLIVELVRGRRAPGTLFAGAAFLFVMLNFISMGNALKQFTNNGLITVVVLLLLSIVLDKSRMLELMAEKLVRGPYRWALVKLYGATAVYSAFLNNTAVVASLIGPLKGNREHSAARLLIPMCYAATLGGTLTLVGTSTNLLVNSLLTGRNMPPLHLFDLFPVGILIVVACGIVMVLVYPRLLKAQLPAEDEASDYFLEAEVLPDCPLIGKTIEEAGLRNLGHLFLTEIVRGEYIIAPVEPDRFVNAGDILVFTGDVTRIDLLAQFPGLRPHGHHDDLPLANLVEVVVAAGSMLARRTIREVDFRSNFDAAVVAVRRGAERLGGSIGNTRLEVGDALVLVVGQDFDKRNNLGRNFVVVSRREVQKFVDPKKSWLSLIGFVAVIALSAFEVIDFLKGMMLLLALFLMSGLARVSDLRRNVPWELIMIIASSLVISEVMISTGAAKMMAGGLLTGADSLGPYFALAVLLLATWILTELMSNNAAAALAFPVALGVAEQLGLSPMPFVMAVLYGASCSFITPYGYQTNLMVMAPGRYTMGDFVRAGLPVALTFNAVALVAIPVFFPFR